MVNGVIYVIISVRPCSVSDVSPPCWAVGVDVVVESTLALLPCCQLSCRVSSSSLSCCVPWLTGGFSSNHYIVVVLFFYLMLLYFACESFPRWFQRNEPSAASTCTTKPPPQKQKKRRPRRLRLFRRSRYRRHGLHVCWHRCFFENNVLFCVFPPCSLSLTQTRLYNFALTVGNPPAWRFPSS